MIHLKTVRDLSNRENVAVVFLYTVPQGNLCWAHIATFPSLLNCAAVNRCIPI